jgi:hypothetical protein
MMPPVLNARDQAWVNALRLFMGDGTGKVAVYMQPDGNVDAQKTITKAFSLYGISPKVRIA